MSLGNIADWERIAATFAPVVYHAGDEPNLPANVDWFLERTSLWFFDSACHPTLKEKVIDRPSQKALITQMHPPDCGSAEEVRSDGTRSRKKQRTFFLEDVSPDHRSGSPNPTEWTTYFHSYPNDIGGITLQYWRFHAYNTGKKIETHVLGRVIRIEFGFHGGDWEGLHIVLDAGGTPVSVRLLGHTGIEEIPWSAMEREDTHPVVYSEKDGHATFARGSRTGIRQETWGVANGAKVEWPGRGTFAGGNLVNVGEKTSPLGSQDFIKYSGLWGSPSTFPDPNSLIFYAASGYWGPAYNETAMAEDGFITAWGAGAAEPGKVVNGVREYYPSSVSR